MKEILCVITVAVLTISIVYVINLLPKQEIQIENNREKDIDKRLLEADKDGQFSKYKDRKDDTQ